MAETYSIYIITFSVTAYLILVYSMLRRSRVKINLSLATILLILPILFVATIRWNVGTDYSNYLSYFKHMGYINLWSELVLSREPLYLLLNYVTFKLFFGAEWSIFMIVGLMTYYLIIKTLVNFKNTSILFFGTFVFLMVFYIETYNLMRQMLALSIVFYSFIYLIDKKPVKYFVLIILASAIHNSAIIALLFYLFNFLHNTKFIKKIYVFLIILSPLFIDYILSFLKNIPLLSFYFEKFDLNFIGYGFGFIIELFPIIYTIILFTFFSKQKNYIPLVYIALLSIPFRFVAYYQIYAMRMLWYSLVVQLLLVPLVIIDIKNKNLKIIVSLSYILIYVIYFIYMYVILNMGPAYPYQSIL